MKKYFNIHLIKHIVLLIVGTVLLNSCNLYPDDDARVEELDIVLSYYDKTVSFSDFDSFFIVDSIGAILQDTSENAKVERPFKKYNDLIIDLIKVNMESRGFVNEEDSTKADLYINVGGVVINNIIIGGIYPPYWWGCPSGWCYPGYGFGYPSYGYYYPWYPVGVVGEYDVGTILIDIIAFKNFDPLTDNTLPVAWSGVLNGLASVGTDSEKRNRVNTGINQLFIQSPYIINN